MKDKKEPNQVKYKKITRFSQLPDDAAFALELLNTAEIGTRYKGGIGRVSRELLSYMATHRDEWQERAEILRQFISEILSREKVPVATNGLEWSPGKVDSSMSLSGEAILVGCLLHVANREPRRLKVCSICGSLFWDESPNLIREICHRVECARERHTRAVRNIRKVKDQQDVATKTKGRKRGK